MAAGPATGSSSAASSSSRGTGAAAGATTRHQGKNENPSTEVDRDEEDGLFVAGLDPARLRSTNAYGDDLDDLDDLPPKRRRLEDVEDESCSREDLGDGVVVRNIPSSAGAKPKRPKKPKADDVQMMLEVDGGPTARHDNHDKEIKAGDAQSSEGQGDTSSDEEDLLDVLLQKENDCGSNEQDNCRVASSKNISKPNIRGKRGPEARKRRMLQRLEQRRQEVGGAGVDDDDENMKGGARGESGELPQKQDRIFDPVIAKHRNSKRLFVTNVSFSTTEEDIRALFKQVQVGPVVGEEQEDGEEVEITEVRMSRDETTEKFSGYCHVGYKNLKHAQRALKKFHLHKLDGRYLFVAPCEPKDAAGKKKIELPYYALPSTLANRITLAEKHPHFEFPDKIQQEMAELHKEHSYAGKNISCIKTAWEKTHNDGEKLDVGEWGFKNFSTAFRTFPYFRMEREAPLLKPQPKFSKPVSGDAGGGSSGDQSGRAGEGEMKKPEEKGKSSRFADKEVLKQHKGSLTYVSYLR